MSEGDLYIDLTWPGLKRDGYEVTSPTTRRYNCVAWAAEDDRRWWWPEEDAYWPEGVPQKATLAAFELLFRSLGYEPCGEDATHEQGYTKVAVFALENEPTHVARQLADGRWTSKLGKIQDIEHHLAGLQDSSYGRVRLVLRRRAMPIELPSPADLPGT